MTALELRQNLIDKRALFMQGKITVDELYKATDEYIEALKLYRKQSGKKFRVPTRAYLIRAL